MSSEKKITLISSDGETFEVEERVALELQSIKHIVEDDSADNVIPLPNVTGNILAKVVEYCNKHVEYAAKAEAETSTTAAPAVVDDNLNNWDSDFINVDESTLFDLVLAAKHLNIESLIDLIFQTVINKIKGKTPEEIRKTFNIKNDYTPEEEEEIRWVNQWAYE